MPRKPWAFCPQCGAALADVPYEGATRRGCAAEGCGFVHYENPVPVAAAIVERPDGVILARNAAWPEKLFGLITGFVERGEHPALTAAREVEEELGLTPSEPTFVGVYDFPQMNQVIIAYHVTVTGEPTLSAELAAWKVIPVEKLRPWPMGTGYALRDWLASRQG